MTGTCALHIVETLRRGVCWTRMAASGKVWPSLASEYAPRCICRDMAKWRTITGPLLGTSYDVGAVADNDFVFRVAWCSITR
jgi:hypothetical protein